jgi:predicted  nucleic acid-binding Zn-ribbon protein
MTDEDPLGLLGESENTSYLGSETIAPESIFEKRRYRITFGCDKCGHEWQRTLDYVPKRNPACPKRSCRESTALEEKDREIARLQAMLAEQRPPGHIGANNAVRAVDETAKIVMEDYGMTDLKDNVRPGENVAPKLPPAQQAAADGMFAKNNGGTNVVDAMTGEKHRMTAAQMNRLKARAIGGAFKGMAVSPGTVQPAAAAHRPALTVVRKEALK